LNKTSGVFSARIQVDPTIDAPTVVYASADVRGDAWYPNGWTTKVTDQAGEELYYDSSNDEDKNRFTFKITDASQAGKIVNVAIIPK
jgi:hypothetical protein